MRRAAPSAGDLRRRDHTLRSEPHEQLARHGISAAELLGSVEQRGIEVVVVSGETRERTTQHTVYYESILSMPVGRPRVDDLVSGIDYWVASGYPARGGH